MSALVAVSPPDLAALRSVMANTVGALHFIAGGTDMLVSQRAFPKSGCIVNIARTHGLSEILVADGHLVIGPSVTLTALQQSADICRTVPVLAEAADLCGSVQIRNRATVGGNLVNASPAGDLIPILVCLGAVVDLLDRTGGARALPVADFLVGSGRTMLREGELVTAIRIPLAPRLSQAHFFKLGPRDDLTISRLNLVVEADYSTGTFGAVCCVAGAIAPKPLALPQVAATLASRALTPQTAAAFLQALTAAVDAAIPGRSSHPYKRRAVMGVGLDVLNAFAGDACPSWEQLEVLL